jgi:hypothetical protein
MPYPQIPFAPASTSARAPLNGTPTVYAMAVQIPNRRHRIEADIIQGTVPVRLELHLYTYPATGFTIRNSFIEAVLPTGTHYVAASSQFGTGVLYRIWRQIINTCPAGCTASHTLRDVIRAAHERLGMPPPTTDELDDLIKAHVPVVPAPAPKARPQGQPKARPRQQAHQRDGDKTRDLAAVQVVPDGAGVARTVASHSHTVVFMADIVADGDYEFSVTPPPLQGQEIYFLTLMNADQHMVARVAGHTLVAALAAGRWYYTVDVPPQFLAVPRTLVATLRPVTVFRSTRADLNNPPDGDGTWTLGDASYVVIYPKRRRAQLRVDVPRQGRHRFTCTDITTSATEPAPATLTLRDAAGVIKGTTTTPGSALEAVLTPGRWWVDVEIPDFHARTTPRKYRCDVGVAGD